MKIILALILAMSLWGCVSVTEDFTPVSIFDTVPTATYEAVVLDNPAYEYIINDVSFPVGSVLTHPATYQVLTHELGTPYWTWVVVTVGE